MPFVTSRFLLLVVMPGATTSVLATSSDAPSNFSSFLLFSCFCVCLFLQITWGGHGEAFQVGITAVGVIDSLVPFCAQCLTNGVLIRNRTCSGNSAANVHLQRGRVLVCSKELSALPGHGIFTAVASPIWHRRRAIGSRTLLRRCHVIPAIPGLSPGLQVLSDFPTHCVSKRTNMVLSPKRLQQVLSWLRSSSKRKNLSLKLNEDQTSPQ